MVVGGAVTLFLLAYVVPKFAIIYKGSSRAGHSTRAAL
jgi:type II secretory pathway component PulF